MKKKKSEVIKLNISVHNYDYKQLSILLTSFDEYKIKNIIN